MRLRPCPDCGGPLHTTATAHACGWAAHTRPDLHDRTEIDRRAQVVAVHRATVGDVCPGWHRAPHPATDLTADHVHEVQDGGDPIGPLVVLCRSCNSRKGATRQAERSGQP